MAAAAARLENGIGKDTKVVAEKLFELTAAGRPAGGMMCI